MRILFLGAGAVGGYFGGRLAEAGADVTFLVREVRAAQLAAGLKIESRLGDAQVPVKLITNGIAEAPFDVIFVACKSYGLDGALGAIAPHVGPETAIVPLLNGFDHIATIEARFPEATVWGGIAHIGATLGPAGEIKHLNKFNRLTVGVRPGQEATADRARAVIDLAATARGVEAVLAEDIVQALWDKWVMLASLAAGTCLMRATVGQILETAAGPALLAAIVDEVVAISEAEGQRPSDALVGNVRAMLSEKGSGWTASMLRDMEQGLPTEGDHILGGLLTRAAAHGVAAPHLAIAHAHVQCYEARRTAT